MTIDQGTSAWGAGERREAPDGGPLHVLLIGIDRYPPGPPGAPSFRALAGSTADVVEVAAYLREAHPDAEVTLLAAPPEGVELPEGAARPTYENIVTAWQHLLDTVPRGGRIYIHYAGHGTRAKTIAPDERASCYDEVIVPCDVNEPDGRYLRDLEIAYLLREMTTRGQLVTLVMDSCHAGGYLETAAPTDRSNGVDDRRAERVPSRVATDEALRALARELRDRRAIASGWAFGDVVGAGYTLIAACQQHEGANELSLADGPRGVLTYYWLDTLRRCRPDVSYATVFQRVAAQVRWKFPGQSPALVGERTRQVLGAGVAPQPRGLIVREVYDDDGRIELSGGEAALVRPGDEYAIVPFQDDADRLDREPLPRVVIDRVFSTFARGDRVGAAGPIERGDQAILVQHGIATAVHVLPPAARASSIGGAAATLDALRAAIGADRSHQLVCGHGGLRVSIDAGAAPPSFAITDEGGVRLLGLGPAIELDDPAAVPALLGRLRHVARFRTVHRHGPADRAASTEALAVALWRTSPGRPATPLPAPARLADGARFELRIRNPSLHDLHLVILELGADWAIRRLRARDAAATILAPGQAWTVSLVAARPAGWPPGAPAATRWKVIATRSPITARELLMPALAPSGVGALERPVAQPLPLPAAPRPRPEVPRKVPVELAASILESVAPQPGKIELPSSHWLAVDVEVETLAVDAEVEAIPVATAAR